MPEMHLRKTELTYSACGPFTKDKERKFQKKNLQKQVIQDRFIKNELDKACFQHDMV